MIHQKKRKSTRHFYPRSPCGERRKRIRHRREKPRHFYPRSPCGERLARFRYWVLSDNISIHALLAESDQPYSRCFQFVCISIHALLAESDLPMAALCETLSTFLSTLSLRRATEQSSSYSAYLEISIHALLAESDHVCQFASAGRLYFYPRSPCGERPSQGSVTGY